MNSIADAFTRTRKQDFRGSREVHYLLPHLGKVALHKICYKSTLGKVVVLVRLRGVLPAWYFAGEQAPVWEFTKLIPSAHFVNFES